MPICYNKLFLLLKEKGITTYYIRKNKIVTETTLQRLRNGDNITTDAICKFCALLNCQPGDIMEYIPDNENGWLPLFHLIK